MHEFVDLDRYPLNQPESDCWKQLVISCKEKLQKNGLFNLPSFLTKGTAEAAADQVKPLFAKEAFTHARKHNIYFKSTIDGVSKDHPALAEFKTVNHTICADQIGDAIIMRLYEWQPFAKFLAAVMGKPRLYTMADPLARVNVMAYRQDEALNWHFDRSEFTTTLLLQSPNAGGIFEYAQDLRSETNPNYDGVAQLLSGNYPTTLMPLDAGTLNVFRGKNTAHRVTPVEGEKERIIAVFSYFEDEGVIFSKEERLGFYGRVR